MPREQEGAGGGPLSLTVQTVAWRAASAARVGVAGVIARRQLRPDGRESWPSTWQWPQRSCSSQTSASTHRPACYSPDQRTSDLGNSSGFCGALVAGDMLLCAAVGALLLPLVNVAVGLGGSSLLAALGAGLLGQSLLYEALNTYGLVSRAAAIETVGGVVQLLTIASARAKRRAGACSLHRRTYARQRLAGWTRPRDAESTRQ